jgi:hypothetical protein
MSSSTYAKGITTEDLRTLLEFWPVLASEGEEIQQGLIADKEIFFANDAEFVGWCYLYELPIRDHLNLAIQGNVQILGDFVNLQQVGDWFGQLKDARSQIGELPSLCSRIGDHFDEQPFPNKDQTEKLRAKLAALVGNALSMFNTLNCIFYHGCFLNELIERVRNGDDDALFAAVRMDVTVIGCLSVVQRISKAAILKDEEFFIRLKNAINGKQAKLEQSNFQKMRLIVEILHEANANRLNDKQLWQLFVEELELYTSNSNPKALRKWVDTYMKKNATT